MKKKEEELKFKNFDKATFSLSKMSTIVKNCRKLLKSFVNIYKYITINGDGQKSELGTFVLDTQNPDSLILISTLGTLNLIIND